MKMRMIEILQLLLCLAVSYTAATGPGSCVGRCGEAFTRGQRCTCDFSCQQHNECCPDFQATCTNAQSCRGRCGEAFRRGRLCECDPDCFQFSTCCQDYQSHCEARVPVFQPRNSQPVRAAASGNLGSESLRGSNSASEEQYTGVRNMAAAHSRAPVSPARGSSLPRRRAPLTPPGPAAVGAGGSALTNPRPSTLQDVAQALALLEGGPEGLGTGVLNDANLCSDSPINGLTALSNGTILIFKGDEFWTVDAISRSVGSPQSVMDTLGVPSPIDTVFTRCNCLGHTYIIKGDQYWRLNGNMVMEPGYPKPLVSEFPGLTGSISAALAVPAAGSRAETVYFFKSGDIMQSFSFPPASTPSCSKAPRGSSRGRLARQADVLLSGEINIRVSLTGFPCPVTSALSMPSPQRSDPYEHYVFSGPLFFGVQTSGDLPALRKPQTPTPSPVTVATAQNAKTPLPSNSIKVWLRCP
ncbi:proteoglycan 4-like isoform X2 [Pungitius pungitius]|uniref:proteoglycan 4-like isoform X2 n=1 Tax=Pungitius pungitius TaxID=134920 RepID=UPI002E0E7376